MQLSQLFPQFDDLQKIYGDKSLDAIYGAGEIQNPDLCLVFMNPTGKNTSSSKCWTGLKAPWIGTKNVWKMLSGMNLFDQRLSGIIAKTKAADWDYDLAQQVYENIRDKSIYITNLSKATQVDAGPLKNKVFKQYLDLFYEEVRLVNPKIIITFGNQVSSVLLGKNIKVSDYRRKHEILTINDSSYKVYPIYYPVGQGMRNMPIAVEDIEWIMKKV